MSAFRQSNPCVHVVNVLTLCRSVHFVIKFLLMISTDDGTFVFILVFKIETDVGIHASSVSV